MQWAALLVDLIKGIAWPAAVVAIAYWFRDDLRAKIPSLTKAGPTGIEWQVQQTATTAKTWSGDLKELPGLQRTPLMGSIEKSIHGELELYKPEAHVDLLVRHLAQSRIESVFERIYGGIFGSQIAGLRALAARGKVAMADTVQFFDDQKSHKGVLPEVTFASWFQFLKNFELIKAENDEVELTDIGKDFLLFISNRGLAENRPG
jgi:hypothetical protein